MSATLPEGLGDGELAVTNAKGKRVPHAIVPTAGGRRLLFEASVPAFGYTTYTVKKTSGNAAAAAPRQIGADEYILENDMYRIVIDPARGGTITSLVAKKEGGKEFADPQHRFAFGELRGFFYDQGQFHSSAQSPATVTVLCGNELEKSVRISGRIDTHPFTQTITLRKGERKIGFDLKIDWQHNVGIGAFRQKDGFNNNHRAFYDDRFNLNILFPAALDAPALYKDAPFDVCKSTLENTHFTTWDNIKHNVILHWVDLAERDGGYGLALLSDHTTSYSYGADAPLGNTPATGSGGATTPSTARRTSGSPSYPTAGHGTPQASRRRTGAGTNRCSARLRRRPPRTKPR